MVEDPESDQIIELLLATGSEPKEIEERPSLGLLDIVGRQSEFLRRATEHFGVPIEQGRLHKTIPELAEHVRAVRRAGRGNT